MANHYSFKTLKLIDMPAVGSIINLKLEPGDSPRQYRVLSVRNNLATVMTMFPVGGASTLFGGTGANYFGSSVDTILTNWYENLSSGRKGAIRLTRIAQDAWGDSASDTLPQNIYKITHLSEGQEEREQISYRGQYSEFFDRYVFAPSVGDFVTYVGASYTMTYENTSLNGYNIDKMLWNTYAIGDDAPIWCRSKIPGDERPRAVGEYTNRTGSTASFSPCVDECYVRGVFVIDLAYYNGTGDTWSYPSYSMTLNIASDELSIDYKNPLCVQYGITIRDGSNNVVYTTNFPSSTTTDDTIFDLGLLTLADGATYSVSVFAFDSDLKFLAEGNTSYSKGSTHIVPSKGNIITLGSDTSHQYRVLKKMGSSTDPPLALVLGMFSVGTTPYGSVQSGATSLLYDGSALDSTFEQWYDKVITEDLREAITEVYVKQDSWKLNGSAAYEYNGINRYNTQYKLSSDNINPGELMSTETGYTSHKVFAPSVLDVLDFLSVAPGENDIKVLSSNEIRTLFFDNIENGYVNIWLRSTYDIGTAFYVDQLKGGISTQLIIGSGEAYPCFVVDLNKIEYHVESFITLAPPTLVAANTNSVAISSSQSNVDHYNLYATTDGSISSVSFETLIKNVGVGYESSVAVDLTSVPG